MVKNYMPPHVLLVDTVGRPQKLITKHGALRPPQDRTPKEADRFIEDAARVLPDAPHLDLIRENLFSYVHDSPDMRAPPRPRARKPRIRGGSRDRAPGRR